jgi:hypothetical protein
MMAGIFVTAPTVYDLRFEALDFVINIILHLLVDSLLCTFFSAQDEQFRIIASVFADIFEF